MDVNKIVNTIATKNPQGAQRILNRAGMSSNGDLKGSLHSAFVRYGNNPDFLKMTFIEMPEDYSNCEGCGGNCKSNADGETIVKDAIDKPKTFIEKNFNVILLSLTIIVVAKIVSGK